MKAVIRRFGDWPLHSGLKIIEILAYIAGSASIIYSIIMRVDIMFIFVLLIESFIIKKLQTSAKELLSLEGLSLRTGF